MVTKQTPPNQIGDSTAAFALATFFPEKAQPWVEWICKICYKVGNMCKFVDAMQSCLKKRQIMNAKKKAEDRKKALEMLKSEINTKEDNEAAEDKKEEENDDPEANPNTKAKNLVKGASSNTSSAAIKKEQDKSDVPKVVPKKLLSGLAEWTQSIKNDQKEES